MNKQTIEIIIPMAGHGKRFRNAGFTMPKPLIQDGFITVPDTPGLGIESFNEELIEKLVCKNIPGALRCGSGFLFTLCGTEGAAVFPDGTLFTKTFAAHGAAGGSFTITMVETV